MNGLVQSIIALASYLQLLQVMQFASRRSWALLKIEALKYQSSADVFEMLWRDAGSSSGGLRKPRIWSQESNENSVFSFNMLELLN